MFIIIQGVRPQLTPLKSTRVPVKKRKDRLCHQTHTCQTFEDIKQKGILQSNWKTEDLASLEDILKSENLLPSLPSLRRVHREKRNGA